MVYPVENIDFFLKDGRKIEYKAENEKLKYTKGHRRTGMAISGGKRLALWHEALGLNP